MPKSTGDRDSLFFFKYMRFSIFSKSTNAHKLTTVTNALRRFLLLATAALYNFWSRSVLAAPGVVQHCDRGVRQAKRCQRRCAAAATGERGRYRARRLFLQHRHQRPRPQLALGGRWDFGSGFPLSFCLRCKLAMRLCHFF